MLAKVVSYGGNSVRYALEKENAKTVKVNNMPDGLDPTAIWYMMKHHCQYHQAERTDVDFLGNIRCFLGTGSYALGNT